ncbi:MAG: hypothetical protein WBV94_10550 [Blastocatellia bacterium]
MFRARLNGEGWPCPQWPLERVHRVYSYVAQMLSDSDGRIYDHWDETTAELARVILSERNQAEFVDNWNYQQQVKNRR